MSVEYDSSSIRELFLDLDSEQPMTGIFEHIGVLPLENGVELRVGKCFLFNANRLDVDC